MKTLIATLQKIDARIYSTILLATLLSLVAVYMYLVGMSAVHVVMSKELNQKVNMLQSDITELEVQYIEAQHMVREEVAMQRGFVAQNDKVFITGSDTTVVLSQENR